MPSLQALLHLGLFSAACAESFISIPLKKAVDASGARVLQEAVSSGTLGLQRNYSFVSAPQESRTLAEKFRDDKYLQHYGRMELGTPIQRFDVTFNPAVTLVTIPSHKLRKKCRGKFRAFDEYSSRTFHSIKETVTVKDMQANVTVNISRDVFHIGNVHIIDQYFGLVQEGSCQKDTSYDGVVGLGFTMNYTTLLDNLLFQKKVNQTIVGMYLDRDVMTHRGGELALGYWNPKYLSNTSTPHFIPIVDEEVPAWQVHVKHAFIGKDQVTFDMFAVIDTKSYYIDLPWHEAEIILQAIGAYNYLGNLIVQCNNVSNLPDLKITIDDEEFILEGSDYVDTVNSYKGYCSVLLRSTRDDVWTLGGAFLGKYYTIFNYEKKQVAFAELVPIKKNGGTMLSMGFTSLLLLLVLLSTTS